MRLYLAKAGLCELLVELLEKHRPLVEDDETRNLFKMACDLIIIILNGGKYKDVKKGWKSLSNFRNTRLLSSNQKYIQTIIWFCQSFRKDNILFCDPNNKATIKIIMKLGYNNLVSYEINTSNKKKDRERV